MTENIADPLQHEGNVTQEVIKPAITGEEVARLGQLIPNAMKEAAAGANALGESIASGLSGLMKGSGSQGGGTEAGVASVTRDQNGQISVMPSTGMMFGFGGGNYAKAAQAGAVSKATQFTQEDITKLQVSNAGNPEGFKTALDGYIQGLKPGLGSGQTGAAIVNKAQQRGSQIYNGMVLQKGSSDIVAAKTGLLSGIGQDQQDAKTLALAGQEGSPEFGKTQADKAAKYAQLTSNPAFGYSMDVANLDQHGQGLEIQGARVENQMRTAYGSGGLQGAQGVVSTIDGMPISDVDKASLTLSANKVLTGLATGNEEGKAANKGSLDSILAVSGKLDSNGNPQYPPISALTDIRDRGIQQGDHDTVNRANAEITLSHYTRATQGLSPSQHDAANGVGQPAPPTAAQPPGGPAVKPGTANFFSSGRAGATGFQFDPNHPDLTTVTTPGGQTAQVNKFAAPSFQGFVNELEQRGYKINDVGGYNNREKRGGSSLSEHAFGNAIDINPSQNSFGGSKTDLPADVSQIAAKYGLTWGGDWHGKKDFMHFEWAGGAPGTSASAAGTPLAPTTSGTGNPVLFAQITAGAKAAGIDPKIMQGIYHGESLGGMGYDVGDNGSSFGPFQLHMGGLAPGKNSGSGMGDDFKRETGLDPRDPNTVQQQIAWVAQKLHDDPSLIKNFHGYANGSQQVGGATGGQTGGQPGQAITWADIAANPALGPAWAKTLAADQETRKNLGGDLMAAASKGLQNNELPSPQVMAQIEQLASNNPGLAEKYKTYSEDVAAYSLANQPGGGGGGQPLIDQARASAASSPDMMYQSIVDRAQQMRDKGQKQLDDHPVAAAITGGWIRGTPVPIDPNNPSSIGQHIAGNAAVVDSITAREPNFSQSVVFKDDKPAFTAALNASAQSAAVTLQAISQLPPDKLEATLADKDVSSSIVGLTRSGDPAKMSVSYGFLGAQLQHDPMAFKSRFGNEALKDMTAWNEHLRFMDPKTLAKTMAEQADPSRVALEEPLRTQAEKNTKTVTAHDVASEMVSTLTQWKGAFSSDAYTPSGINPAQAREALLSDYKSNYADSFAKYGDDKSARTYAAAQVATKWGPSDSNGGRVMAWPPERSPALPVINGSQDWIQKQASANVIEGIAQFTQDPVERRAMIGAPYVLAPDARTEAEMTGGKVPSYPVVVKAADGRAMLLPGRFQPDPVQAKADADAANAATNRAYGRGQ